ncbi:MAG: hypothetical protein Q9Q40_02635 [Acidobacteriota bacterium]|nr:hypothetical protein [Acidobacteriota bacterium]
MFYYGIASGVGSQPWTSAAKLPLDPVDSEIVGKLLVWELKERAEAMGVQFTDGLRWLRDAEPYRVAAAGIDPRRSATMWRDHLNSLADWRICQQLAFDTTVTALCRYFGVPKTELSARSIVDCRTISIPIRQLVGAVNLASIPDILTRLARVIRQSKERAAILLSDLRHFFHQLALHDDVREFFTVRLDSGETYMWCVLPMGHTVSPKVAQTVAHCLLSIAMGSAPTGEKLPHFQWGRNLVATIFYDNLIAGGGLTSVEKLQREWESTAGRYHARLKYNDVYTRQRLQLDDVDAERESQERPVALGIRLGVKVSNGEKNLHFRHSAANVSRWKAIADDETKTVTLRFVAQLVGICSFDHYVTGASRCAPGGFPEELAMCARRLGRLRFARAHASGLSSWDTKYDCKEAATDVASLRERICHIARNPWYSVVKPHEVGLMIATDSSSTHAGADVYNTAGEHQKSSPRWKWEGEDAQLHITAKELKTILLTLEWDTTIRDMHIRFGCDAMVVVQLSKRGYSGSTAMQTLWTSLEKLALQRNVTFEIIWIPGVDNAADIGTRPDESFSVVETRRRHLATSTRLLHNVASSTSEPMEATDAIESLRLEGDEIDAGASR